MNTNLVIFDWAGTLVDYGCRAPMVAFLDAFEACGLAIDEATARKPMGAHKRDHVREILATEAVAARARSLPTSKGEGIGDQIYAVFCSRLLEVLPDHAEPIPGAVQTLAWLREHGIAVGSTTGYTRAMMDVLEPVARAAGIAPDCIWCADEVPRGRPAPWACFRIAEQLQRYPLAHAVKVGDTPSDIDEGRNAGMQVVAISETGNEVGLGRNQLQHLPAAEREQRVQQATARLMAAGADVVLRSVEELPAWLQGETLQGENS
jgi:phosphonoacetaldehyde hydrolase